MGTLYNRIQDLCKNKGVSGSRMCLDLGISKSTLSDMKHGRTKGVSTDTAKKIASYLNVTVGYLLGEEEKKPTPVSERGQSVNIVKIVGRDGSFIEKHLSDDQINALKTLICQLPDASDDLPNVP